LIISSPPAGYWKSVSLRYPRPRERAEHQKKEEADRFPKRKRRRRRQIPGEERKSIERALIASLKCSI
jgi:hypothetical protein